MLFFTLDESIGNNFFKILPRSYWSAALVRGVLPKNTLPIRLVVVVATQTNQCFSLSECVNIIHRRQIYDFQSLHEPNIVYNFTIGGDGIVYTGRGWDSMGDHTKGYNLRIHRVIWSGLSHIYCPTTFRWRRLTGWSKPEFEVTRFPLTTLL